MLKMGTLAIVLLAAAPAGAGTQANSTTQPPAQTAVNPLDKIICRTEEGLGSRLDRKRVCMTVRQWKEQSEDSRQALERLQQQGEANPNT
jgi:hypothetical protein